MGDKVSSHAHKTRSWYLLRVLFKFSDEHSRLLCMRVPQTLNYPLHLGWDIAPQSYPTTVPCPVRWPLLSLRETHLFQFLLEMDSNHLRQVVGVHLKGTFDILSLGMPSIWPSLRNFLVLISRDIFVLRLPVQFLNGELVRLVNIADLRRQLLWTFSYLLSVLSRTQSYPKGRRSRFHRKTRWFCFII